MENKWYNILSVYDGSTMKKIFILSFLIMINANCYYSLQKTPDTVTGATIVTLDIWHKAIEGNLYNYLTRYTKKITNGKSEPTRIFLQFYNYYYEPKLEENAIIQVDNVNFNVKLTDAVANKVGRNDMLSGTIILTPQIEQATMNCKSFLIRVSVANKNTTLKPNDKKL